MIKKEETNMATRTTGGETTMKVHRTKEKNTQTRAKEEIITMIKTKGLNITMTVTTKLRIVIAMAIFMMTNMNRMITLTRKSAKTVKKSAITITTKKGRTIKTLINIMNKMIDRTSVMSTKTIMKNKIIVVARMTITTKIGVTTTKMGINHAVKVEIVAQPIEVVEKA
jgi:hypothetical protein